MKTFLAITSTIIVTAASLVLASPAHANDIVVSSGAGEISSVSPADVAATVDALSAEGRVESQSRDDEGNRVSVIDAGEGATLTITEAAAATSRLSGGKDNNGFYVSFTNTDQAIIMGGARESGAA